MSATTLGMDLGVASVGWCLVDDERHEVVAAGVRVFEMAVEPKSKEPKNRKRRAARLMRRNVRRRQMRRDALVRLLREHGLLPGDPAEWARLFDDHAKNPYALRAKGLDERLALHEFGRALYHINRRRGFKSNRGIRLGALAKDPEIAALLARDAEEKAERAASRRREDDEQESEEEKEEGTTLQEIAALRAEMQAAGSRTLGEHFHRLLSATDEDGCLVLDPVRRRHTERAMYEEEFEALWEAQARHHTGVLTPGLKARVYQCIFHQRPLKVQRFFVGNCRYERGRHRCDRDHPDAHEFRIWQLLNHLSYRLPGEGTDTPLTLEQRQMLAEKLATTAKLSWAGVRKELKLKKAVFSHEGKPGHEKEIQGNATLIRIEKAVPGLWDKLDAGGREALIAALFTIERKDSLVRHLRSRFGLSTEQAYRLAIIEFKGGVASLSLQAIRNILPHLKEGRNYHDAVQAAAERLRSEGRPNKADLYLHAYEQENETFEALPLDRLPNARNPVVNKCLHEVRKLVNAIVREHGKPAVVRIELARDLKLNKKDKERLEAEIKRNTRLYEEADKAFATLHPGKTATRTDRIKYRLWKECEGVCPYTGTEIPLAQLWGPEVDIEHIVPFSRCLDDSQANKALCMARENRMVKRNQTPYEAYHGTDQYEQILQRADAMKCGRHKKKLFRLTPEEVEELYGDLAKRHLVDTRYIAVLARQYLQLLGVEVQVANGKATAALRHRWGLNSILAPDAADDEERAEKNRSDHRHHAVDAAVIAATSPAYLKRLSEANSRLERDEESGKRPKLGDADWVAPPPWQNFRSDLARAVDGIVVSHQATRGLSGALHEETAYGWDPKAKVYTVRKPVLSLTVSELDNIRDPKLRERVRTYRAEVERLKEKHKAAREAGEAPGAFVEPELRFQDRHRKWRTVRRVKVNTRLSNPEKMLTVRMRPSEALPLPEDDRAEKSMPFGSNHHFVLYHDRLSDRCLVQVVTMHEAARRAVRGKPIFQAGLPNERYVPAMALCANDIVEVEGMRERIYRIVKFSTPGKDRNGREGIDLGLQALNVSRSYDYRLGDPRWTSTDKLKAIVRRVAVDRLGRVFPAVDRFG